MTSRAKAAWDRYRLANEELDIARVAYQERYEETRKEAGVPYGASVPGLSETLEAARALAAITEHDRCWYAVIEWDLDWREHLVDAPL